MSTTQIVARDAGQLGPAPEREAARRARASVLLGTGRVTLAAIAQAWYAGDVAAARAEIYPRRAGTRLRATIAAVAPAAPSEPWSDWDGR